MNQTLLEPETKQVPTQQAESTNAPDNPERPPAPAHPRFAKPQRIAFVQACWHREVVQEAHRLPRGDGGAPRSAHLRRPVRGARLVRDTAACADSRQDAALHRDRRGRLVVDGGIYRHEFVADTVIKALMDVQLRTEVPIFSAVLTPQQFHESSVHYEFFRKHFAIKGVEVAEACADTLHGLERLRGQVAAGIV